MPRPKKNETETVENTTAEEVVESKTEEVVESKTEKVEPEPLLTTEERDALLEISEELHRTYTASNSVPYREKVQRLRNVLSSLLER